MQFTKEDLVYFADKLAKTESKFFERFQLQILNPINASQLLSINKIVIDGNDDFVYRIGDYNSLLTQFITIQYMKSIKCSIFLDCSLVYHNNKILVTKQKKVDYISCDVDVAKKCWEDKDIQILEQQGIFGLDHNNIGYINNYPYILDWMGGPIIVENQLKDWKGVVLYNIDKKEFNYGL